MEMQGQLVGQKPIRISGATPRKTGATMSTTTLAMPSLIPTMNPAMIPTLNPAIVPSMAPPTLPSASPAASQYYPYVYNPTTGGYTMDPSASAAYYSSYVAPPKIIDFTAPVGMI